MTRRNLVIAICGAEGSGKSDLVSALAEALFVSNLDVTIVEPFNGDACFADLFLLCGLQLPEGHPAAGPLKPDLCAAEDSQLRAALMHSGVSFQVIYGAGTVRLESALRAISALKKMALNVDMTIAAAPEVSTSSKRWQWACDKCSDPQCEHTLFTDLVK